jgi:threonylcarbamoyladenosine tRNA methylthiotransferase MtaB
MNRTAAIHTIGCRLNQADSALICGRLRLAGWRVVETDCGETVDLLIINSCSVTGAAAQKSRQAARRFRKLHPGCRVILTGCSAEADHRQWLRDGAADLVIPNPDKKNIIALIHELFEGEKPSPVRFSMEEKRGAIFTENAAADFPFKSRAFIKVQEGCENFCSYCIVPYTRGPERSRAWDEIVGDFEQLLARGFHEIVLTGVNICAYQDGGRGLPELIDTLCSRPGDYRIRLSSTEPHPDNRELIDAMARNPKVCRFLHLALQHGSDIVLRAMNRKYTAAGYREFAEAARAALPGIHIGTDLIVGFPGETDELFDESCRLVEEMKFANMHVFSFSPRQGTPAASMPGQVPSAVAKERYARLQEIAAASKKAFHRSQLGIPVGVIFEKEGNGVFSGWSDNYIHISSTRPGIRLHEITEIVPFRQADEGLAE